MKHTDSVNSDDKTGVPSDMKHTPTPWYKHTTIKVAYDTMPHLEVLNAREVVIHPEAEANAAFIVRAANSHQALVEALTRCVNDADKWADKQAAKLASLDAADGLPYSEHHEIKMPMWYEQARAALASATR